MNKGKRLSMPDSARHKTDALIERIAVRERFEREKQIKEVNPVEVHLTKLAELPNPLSAKEFRTICQQQGLPVPTQTISQNMLSRGVNDGLTLLESFEQSTRLQQVKENQKWNNVASNLYGVYLQIYELFKQWHSNLVKQRDFGPDSVVEHINSKQEQAPFLAPRYSMKPGEEGHLVKQKALVDLLIEFGVGNKDMINSANISSYNQHTNNAYNKRATSQNSQSRRSRPFSPFDKSQRSSLAVMGEINQPSTNKQQIPAAAVGTQSHSPNNRRNGQNKGAFAENSHFAEVHLSQIKEKSASDYSDTHQRTNESRCVTGEFSGQNNQSSGDPEIFTPLTAHQVSQNAFERIRAMTLGQKILPNYLNEVSFDDQSDDRMLRLLQSKQLNQAEGPSAQISDHNHTQQMIDDDKDFYSLPKAKKLREELIESKRIIAEYSQKLNQQEDKEKKLRANYNRQEVERTVQAKIMQLPFSDGMSSLERNFSVKLFDATEGLNLDPDTTEILNTKLADIREYFMDQLQMVTYQQEALAKRVSQFENLHKDGLKFSDFDTTALVRLIAESEELKREQVQNQVKIKGIEPTKLDLNRPLAIWKLFQEYFGQDYFLEVIEEEYEISPGSNEFFSNKIRSHFENEVTAFKTELDINKNFYVKQLEELQVQIEEKDEEIAKLQRQEKKSHELVVKEIRTHMHTFYKQSEEAIVKNMKHKLTAAQDMITNLNQQREQYRSQKSMQQNYAFKRWQMFTTIKRILANLSEKKKSATDKQVVKTIDQFIKEEQLILRYQKEFPPQLVKPYMNLDKIMKHKLRREQSEFLYSWHSNRADIKTQVVESQRQEIEALRASVQSLKTEVPYLYEEKENLKVALIKKEEENAAIVEKIEMLEQRFRSNARDGNKHTAKTIYNALKLKSINEMAAYKIRIGKQLQRNQRNGKNVGTITDELCDLQVQIQMVLKDTNQVYNDKEVQAQPEVCDQRVQAVKKVENQKVGETLMVRPSATQTTEPYQAIPEQQQQSLPEIDELPKMQAIQESERKMHRGYPSKNSTIVNQKEAQVVVPNRLTMTMGSLGKNKSQFEVKFTSKKNRDDFGSTNNSVLQPSYTRRNTIRVKAKRQLQENQPRSSERAPERTTTIRQRSLKKTQTIDSTSGDWNFLSKKDQSAENVSVNKTGHSKQTKVVSTRSRKDDQVEIGHNQSAAARMTFGGGKVPLKLEKHAQSKKSNIRSTVALSYPKVSDHSVNKPMKKGQSMQHNNPLNLNQKLNPSQAQVAESKVHLQQLSSANQQAAGTTGVGGFQYLHLDPNRSTSLLNASAQGSTSIRLGNQNMEVIKESRRQAGQGNPIRMTSSAKRHDSSSNALKAQHETKKYRKEEGSASSQRNHMRKTSSAIQSTRKTAMVRSKSKKSEAAFSGGLNLGGQATNSKQSNEDLADAEMNRQQNLSNSKMSRMTSLPDQLMSKNRRQNSRFTVGQRNNKGDKQLTNGNQRPATFEEKKSPKFNHLDKQKNYLVQSMQRVEDFKSQEVNEQISMHQQAAMDQEQRLQQSFQKDQNDLLMISSPRENTKNWNTANSATLQSALALPDNPHLNKFETNSAAGSTHSKKSRVSKSRRTSKKVPNSKVGGNNSKGRIDMSNEKVPDQDRIVNLHIQGNEIRDAKMTASTQRFSQGFLPHTKESPADLMPIVVSDKSGKRQQTMLEKGLSAKPLPAVTHKLTTMQDTSHDVYSSDSRSRLIDGTIPTTQESKLRTESEELLSTENSQKQQQFADTNANSIGIRDQKVDLQHEQEQRHVSRLTSTGMPYTMKNSLASKQRNISRESLDKTEKVDSVIDDFRDKKTDKNRLTLVRESENEVVRPSENQSLLKLESKQVSSHDNKLQIEEVLFKGDKFERSSSRGARSHRSEESKRHQLSEEVQQMPHLIESRVRQCDELISDSSQRNSISPTKPLSSHKVKNERVSSQKHSFVMQNVAQPVVVPNYQAVQNHPIIDQNSASMNQKQLKATKSRSNSFATGEDTSMYPGSRPLSNFQNAFNFGKNKPDIDQLFRQEIISEEQYLALKLVEKGFIPQRPQIQQNQQSQQDYNESQPISAQPLASDAINTPASLEFVEEYQGGIQTGHRPIYSIPAGTQFQQQPTRVKNSVKSVSPREQRLNQFTGSQTQPDFFASQRSVHSPPPMPRSKSPNHSRSPSKSVYSAGRVQPKNMSLLAKIVETSRRFESSRKEIMMPHLEKLLDKVFVSKMDMATQVEDNPVAEKIMFSHPKRFNSRGKGSRKQSIQDMIQASYMPTKTKATGGDFRIKKHKKLTSQQKATGSLLPKLTTQTMGQNQTLASSGRSATQFVAQGGQIHGAATMTASTSALATKRPFTRSDLIESAKISQEQQQIQPNKLATAHSQRIFKSSIEPQQPLYNEYQKMGVANAIVFGDPEAQMTQTMQILPREHLKNKDGGQKVSASQLWTQSVGIAGEKQSDPVRYLKRSQQFQDNQYILKTQKVGKNQQQQMIRSGQTASTAPNIENRHENIGNDNLLFSPYPQQRISTNQQTLKPFKYLTQQSQLRLSVGPQSKK